MLTIMNTSIITNYGLYDYRAATLEQVKEMIKLNNFQSAIGHESTAAIISTLLNIDCPVNRIMYQQEVGDSAIVFKLNGRPPEGKILSTNEVNAIGYTWGILYRGE